MSESRSAGPRKKAVPTSVLMLLTPVLALLGYGYHLQSVKEAPSDDGSWRTLVTTPVVEPGRPGDVSEGYDTRVTMHVGTDDLSRIRPALRTTSPYYGFNQGAGKLIEVRNGRKRVVYDDRDTDGAKAGRPLIACRLNVGGKKPDGTPDAELTYLLRLKDVPASSGALLLQGAITCSAGYMANGKGWGVLAKTATFSVPVRATGARIDAPAPFRLRPFSTIQKTVRRVNGIYGRMWRVELAVKMEKELLNPDHGTVFVWKGSRLGSHAREGQACIDDSSGQSHFMFTDASGALHSLYPQDVTGDDSSICRFNFEFPEAQLPLGRLVFRTSLSVNDSWPQNIQVVIREK